MIVPADRELIAQMVGHDRFETGYPANLVKEYEIRARMLSSIGTTGGIGPVAVMGLLRDFNIGPTKPPLFEDVKDWRDVEPGAIIYYRGDRGRFVSAGEAGRIFVKMDGYRAEWEVPRDEVSLKVKAPMEEDVDPEDEPVRMGAIETSTEPVERAEPTEEEILFGKWIAVDPMTKVTAMIDGEEVEGEFVSIDGTDITLYVDEEAVSVEASKVQLPEEAPAEA